MITIPHIGLIKKLVAKSTHHQHHHASLVIKGGAILAMGSNVNNVHAEVNALKKLWPSERKNTTVWSIRITKSGLISTAKPCLNCLKFLVESGVKTVYYSDADGTITRMRL